jgi:hypothetical protein
MAGIQATTLESTGVRVTARPRTVGTPANDPDAERRLEAAGVRVLEELARVRTFVIAFAAAMVVASYAEQRGDTRLAGWLFLLGPLFVLAWILAWHLYRRRLADRFESFEQRIAYDQRPMPDRFAVIRGELRSLGFGGTTTIESRYPWQRWRLGWLSLDRGATTAAHVSGREGVTLVSYWPDGASVTTTNKRPASRVELPGVRQVSVRGQAAEAYRAHLAACATFAESHGSAMPIAGPSEALAAEKLVRPGLERAYRTWTMRRTALLTELAVSALAAVLIALGLARLAAGAG